MDFEKLKETERVGEPARQALKEPGSIDFTLPREAWSVEERKAAKACPRCQARLQPSYQTYAVATREGADIQDSFLMGTDALGFYCPQCPTVVLVSSVLRGMLSHSLPNWRVGSESLVAGIVDLDAIPEDKRDLPLGSDENPLTVVPFSYHGRLNVPGPQRVKSGSHKAKKKRPRPRRRRCGP